MIPVNVTVDITVKHVNLVRIVTKIVTGFTIKATVKNQAHIIVLWWKVVKNPEVGTCKLECTHKCDGKGVCCKYDKGFMGSECVTCKDKYS